MTSRARVSRLLELTLVAALTASGPAAAQAPPAAHAKGAAALAEGMKLFNAGQTHEACEKLAESMRLEPAGATQLNLALCHEKEGKTATAWRELTELSKRGARDGQGDIAVLARQHAAALEPHLSRLTLVAAPGARVADVRLDGAKLARADWAVPIVVDPGPHVVIASESGKTAIEHKLNLATGAAQTVTLGGTQPEAPVATSPVLALPPPAPPAAAPPPPTPTASPPAAPSPVAQPVPRAPSSAVAVPPQPESTSVAAAGAPAPAPVSESAAPPASHRLSPGRLTAVVVGGVGIASVVVGGVSAIVAASKWSQAQQDCSPSCNASSPAIAERSAAVSAADVSTVAFIAGGAALAAGAVVYFVAPSGGAARSTPAVVPVWVPGVGGVVLRGTF